MKLEGETMALQNSNFSLGGYPNMNMLAGVMSLPQRSMIPPPMPLPHLPHPAAIFSTSGGLSLGLQHSLSDEGGQPPFRDSSGSFAVAIADSCEAALPRRKEDETESKSSSDNAEAGSGEEHEDMNPRPTKKRYHRHTVHQIAEMERMFKECPHPDEKQRQELSRELKLSPRQIKFWFQNKRTQMKALHERQDNSVLRSENEKLKAENYALREAVRHVSCPNCGGPARLTEMSYEEQQLRMENVKLREEIERITAMAAKYIGRPVAAINSISSSSPSASSLLVEDGALIKAPFGDNGEAPAMAPNPSPAFCLADAEKPAVVELAIAGMEELLQLWQANEPLWMTDPITGLESIDGDAYLQRFNPRGGANAMELKAESSRCSGLVIMNPNSIVETLMDANRWAEMFPSIVSRVENVEILSTGIGGTYDDAIQLMYAELQLPSPLVPTREIYFVRYSKRVDHLWVVVDVSVDSVRGGGAAPALRCRKRPSGCVIEGLPNGYSKVSWVEHAEADNRGVHSLYQYLVSTGMGYGAKRWLCKLQRQSERMASLLATAMPPAADINAMVVPSAEGRRGMLKLAERMSNSFCGGVSACTAHTWVTLAGGGEDVRVVIRKSVDDEPGRPAGIVLSAATSLWLPISPIRLFHFLRDERFRTEWDILSNTGVVEEMCHVAKGQEAGNCVSLLRVNPANANQSNMLILQDCSTDESCSLIVYAPVDVAAMSTVLNGGDADCVALLPSGFAILPDGGAATPKRNNQAASSGGCLLTVAFQILVDHVPTARLSLGSVATVNKLISNTVVRIKNALMVAEDESAD